MASGSPPLPTGERSDSEDLVLDSSVALAWSFQDEVSPYSEAILDHLALAAAVVPGIWPLEIANALLVAERRGRATQARIAEIIDVLTSLPITVDEETSERAMRDTLSLGRTQNLSAYDAAYLELAMRRGLPLATLDQRLRNAAAAVGVQVYTAT
jgi:predicted nucleic acid-binding protein